MCGDGKESIHPVKPVDGEIVGMNVPVIEIEGDGKNATNLVSR